QGRCMLIAGGSVWPNRGRVTHQSATAEQKGPTANVKTFEAFDTTSSGGAARPHPDRAGRGPGAGQWRERAGRVGGHRHTAPGVDIHLYDHCELPITCRALAVT